MGFQMSHSLAVVRLYGWLGKKYGRVHRLAVLSAAEAVHALCSTIPGFEKDFLANGSRYACFIGKRNLAEDEVAESAGNSDIRIAPVVMGSKRGGLFQTVLGAALITAAFAFPTSLGLAATGLWSTATVGSMGIAMALGGVMQMISPQQRGLSTRDNPENGASYNFNGPVNTTAQGNCVPVLYGEAMIGSAVVSAGIIAEDAA